MSSITARGLCVVALGCLASACAEAPAAPPVSPAAATEAVAVDDGDLVSLLPATVDSVLTIDLQRVRGARVAAPLLEALAREGPLQGEGRTARGFDEVTDVDRWVFARYGPPGGERATIELGRGRFDRDRIERAFTQRFPDATATTFGGMAGVTRVGAGVVVLSPRVVAFGPPWALRVLAGVRAGRTAWLQQAERSMPAKLRAAGPAAVELLLRATPSTLGELEALLAVRPPVAHVSARLDLHDDAHAYLVATGTTEAAAAEMAAGLQEALAELRGRPSIEALGLGPAIARATVASRGTRMLGEMGLDERDRSRLTRNLARLGALLSRGRAGDSPAPSR
jgi:hypothetical protein